MSRFSYIDLSSLPAPTLVDPPEFEALLQDNKDLLISLDNASENPLNVSALLELESEPLAKYLQLVAYREMNLIQRTNEAVKARLLAFAMNADLDQVAANMSVRRKLLDPGDPDAVPPVDPVYENDESLRLRTQLAPEAMTTAGSDGSYKFNALSAGDTPSDVSVESPEPGIITVTYTFDPDSFGAKVKDATAFSPTPGQVTVTVLGHSGDGSVDAETLQAVEDHLTGKYVRPLTDLPTIQGAQILPYQVDATLYLFDGPDSAIVKAEATDYFWKYASSRHVLGGAVTRSGIDAALQRTGVNKVELQGWTDIESTEEQAPFCTGFNLTVITP